MNGDKQSKKKPIYPNNWQTYKDQPDDFFVPHEFDEVMEWRVESWELPSSVACIFRLQNKKTGKVTEKVYQKQGAATKRLHKLLEENTHDITICSAGAMHHIVLEDIINEEAGVDDN